MRLAASTTSSQAASAVGFAPGLSSWLLTGLNWMIHPYLPDKLGVATGQGLKKVDESCHDVVVLVNVPV